MNKKQVADRIVKQKYRKYINKWVESRSVKTIHYAAQIVTANLGTVNAQVTSTLQYKSQT